MQCDITDIVTDKVTDKITDRSVAGYHRFVLHQLDVSPNLRKSYHFIITFFGR